MKKLEFIIRPERLEDVKEVLNALDIKGMTVTSVMGCGSQKGLTESYRGVAYHINLLPKMKVETVVKDEAVDKVIQTVSERLKTGKIGDGKIFVSDVSDAYRVRTGENGESAL